MKTIDLESSNNGLTAEQLEAAVLVTLFKGEELNHLLYINNGYSYKQRLLTMLYYCIGPMFILWVVTIMIQIPGVNSPWSRQLAISKLELDSQD